MAGIYIHIPYCKKACNYCDFHFSTSLQSFDEMIHCILKEIELRKEDISESIKTLYFGGGTPSILSPKWIERITEKLNQNFDIQLKEYTLECNPDDINEDRLKHWKSIGINRLSIGIQSFYQEHLTWMNRSHNAEQAEKSIELALENGFTNMTIDLIYGFPQLTNEQLVNNIQKVIQFQIPHVSAYALTIEPKTVLGYQYNKGKYQPMIDELINHQFGLIMDTLSTFGYEQYEISNYALPGYRSKHNTNYWNKTPYLGFGPGAHSYQENKRSWNISHNIQYIKQLKANVLPSQFEILNTIDIYNEYVLTGLRRKEGLSMEVIQKQFPEFENHFMDAISPFVELYVVLSDSRYFLNRNGKNLADYIASELFITD